jgi:hypothetical protein
MAENLYEGFTFEDLFLNTSSKARMAEFDLDSLTRGTFGFHWHNNWDKIVQDRSPLSNLFARSRTKFDAAWAAGTLKRYDIPS